MNQLDHMDTSDNRPTAKQLAVIRRLASRANVDMGQVRTKQRASQLIDRLLQKYRSQRRNDDQEGRGAVYAMVTKLVADMYQQQGRLALRHEKFWLDVDEFYRQYIRHRDRCIMSDASLRQAR